MTDAGVLDYGSGNFALTNEALANFPGASFRGYSLCCTPIELLANDGSDTVLFTATGFFWLGERPYLITNWHVISGRNPFTGEILSEQGFIPSRFRFYGLELELSNGIVQIVRRRYQMSGDENVAALLSTPPQVNGVPVDIWAFPLQNGMVIKKDASRVGFVGADIASGFINEQSTSQIETAAGDDCYILGYPLQNSVGGRFPIWKRGSIASETPIGVDNKPMFLVDAAVTRSMSGSPVVRKVTTLVATVRQTGHIREMQAFEFIGIYAGRLESKSLMATNIGYAWFQTLIPRVIEFYRYSNWTAVPKPD
jgi:hypothetical protein